MKDQERLVLVTGAGRGVGAATVKALLAMPHVTVIAVSRSLQALMDAVGPQPRMEACTLDLGGSTAAERLAQVVGARRLHALVHNAGHLHKADMGMHQRADLERVFLTNAIAPLELSQALAANLAGDPPGHIVHIGSMGGFQDSAKFPGLVAYSASKAALACTAQCLAEEFKDRGIRSNCLALGSVDTEMLRAAFPGFRAGTTADAIGAYVAEFSLHGHNLFNGKVLPVATTTP
ncbi:MAG TPA: SDR family oxidoreductase [Flavobacteriales bacterium]|nr:SDR family oxidoreductase [Flavobacteriales bacterium]